MIHSLKSLFVIRRCRTISSVCLLAVSFCFTSCIEPSKKPIPKLDPEKAIKDDPIVSETKSEKIGSRGALTSMTIGVLYQLVQSNAALVYDVRPIMIYKTGHIPGAISFPESHFDQDIEKHEAQIVTANKNKTPVVIYCTDANCPDAFSVATKLAAKGLDISILEGGYAKWKSSTN